MSIGVSTACFYPNLTEKSVEYLAKSGIKTIEIFFKSQSETSVRFYCPQPLCKAALLAAG